MICYKLLRQRKDGSLGPLFIGTRLRIEIGQWHLAEDIPTRGYAHRPGWHAGAKPIAEHLTERGRLWVECEISSDIVYTPETHPHLFTEKGDMKRLPSNGYYLFPRPKHQGGQWVIADKIRPLRILNPNDIAQLRRA